MGFNNTANSLEKIVRAVNARCKSSGVLRSATRSASSERYQLSPEKQSVTTRQRCCTLQRGYFSTTILYSRGSLRQPGNFFSQNIQTRYFENESEYHHVADETLETIQDVVEEAMENAGLEAEISLASGVLTMSFPQGTYVINKQTPNRQVWWSSPISGPRRYEYDEADGKWVFTREESITLGESLKEEFQELFKMDLNLDL